MRPAGRLPWLAVPLLMMLGSAGAGLAQQDAAACDAVWSKLNGLLAAAGVLDGPVAATAVTAERQQCMLRDLQVPAGIAGQFRARSLGWEGEGLDRFTAEGLPPTALRLTIDGIRFVPLLDEPVMQYLLAEQSVPFGVDVTLSLRWHADEGQLLLEQFEADFPGDNAVRVTAMADGIDLSSHDAMRMSVGSVALREVTANITSNGLFESYALFVVGGALLGGAENPAGEVARLKAQAIVAIDDFPAAIYPDASREALKALVRDMPHPKGTLRVAMTADPGLGPARFLSLSKRSDIAGLDDIWPLLDGVRYDIRYDRQDGDE